MVNVKKEGVLLDKTKLAFECEGVLNPAVIEHDGAIHMFYRAVAKGNHSTVGYCRLSSPLSVEYRNDEPLLRPQCTYEVHGIEDARIVKIEDVFYMTYTAYDGANVYGTLVTSKDLKHFERSGILTPQIPFYEFHELIGGKAGIVERYLPYNNHSPASEEGKIVWDKNVVFFPRKIDGKFFFFHRIKPDVQIASVEKLEDLTDEFWNEYIRHIEDHIVLSPKQPHELSYLGAGCPPIETEAGWLVIYHGVCGKPGQYIYSACAALLDLEQPNIEIARLPYALFSPDEAWEIEGEVNNVCFPTGTVLEGETLYIYYGAADEQIATASVNINELITELLLFKL